MRSARRPGSPFSDGAVGVLDGRVTLVTGAARGNGAAIATTLRGEGVAVVATDIIEPETAPDGDDQLFLHHDVREAADWQAALDRTLERFGRIDVLVNNAGVMRAQTLQETDAEAIDFHYRTNQLSVYLGMRAVLTPMQAAGRGSIINIATVAAVRGSAGAFAYSMTKWAVRGMTRSAARDLAGSGVRVNAVLPGLIDTAMVRANPPDRVAAIRQAIPLDRVGQPEDVAAAVLILASDASAYMTGAEIIVDGGLAA